MVKQLEEKKNIIKLRDRLLSRGIVNQTGTITMPSLKELALGSRPGEQTRNVGISERTKGLED